MKRNRFLVGIFLLVMLSVGVIAASGSFPPEGPLAFLHEQIGLLDDAVDELRLESDDQQDQICDLFDLTGLSPPPRCGIPDCPETDPDCNPCIPSKTTFCP